MSSSDALRLAHRDARHWSVLGTIKEVGGRSEPDPARGEYHASQQHQLARNWTETGTLHQLEEARYRHRVNGDLAVIGECLDAENPDVIAAQPPTDGASKADVMARRAVVFGEHLGPFRIGHEGLAAQHGGIEISLNPAGSRPPHIEVAVTPRLKNQEDDAQNACKQERQGRGFRPRKRHRERDAKRDHRPVCRVVEAGAPDSTAVNLSAIKMCKRANGWCV